MNSKIEKVYNEVSKLLKERKYKDAHKKIESVDTELLENNIIEYLRAICNQEIGNVEIAIKQFTKILDKDPTFIKAAEILVNLNKSSYSIGELKYFYELISAVKSNNKMRAFIRKYRNVPSEFNPEPNIQKMTKNIRSRSPKKLNGNNKNLNPLIKELKLNAEKYKNEIKNNTEKKSPKSKLAIMPDADAESNKKKSKKIVDKSESKFSKKENDKGGKKDNKENIDLAINVETLTIARLYIKQGYYNEALDILLKLKKRDGVNNKKILETIEEVKKLIQTEK